MKAPETPQDGARRLFARDIAAGFTPVALHPYTDRDGQALFYRPRLKHDDGRKVIKPMRLEGMRFVLGEPEPPEAGKPLYRLPDLVADPTAIVWVVEGENCADALVKAGVVATTSGGASSAGAADWSPLQGRTVRIWPDHDDPGHAYARDVGDRLRALQCEVDIIQVDGMDLPDGGDVVDLFAAFPSAADPDYLDTLPTQPHVMDDGDAPLGERLAASMTPWTEAELAAARDPHPHVFTAYERGLFPIGEVTVAASRGRGGKTTLFVAVATALAIEHSLTDLQPMKGRSVVIYSAEDDRAQYARKVAAQRSLMSAGHADALMRRIIVPDLDAPGMEPLRRLVTVVDRQPIPTGTDLAIIDAMTPMMQGEFPPALLIFETVSTLSDAEEDNRSHAMLIDCLKRIARALDVAIVLVHHTSQASDAGLVDLSIGTAAVRGGTTLIYNSRQNLLVLDLGSDADPLPANDARSVLRELVAPDCPDRITALVAMESSKAMDPAPVWFRWERTDYGPAAVELDPPEHLVGKSWRKVREMAMAERGSRRQEAKATARADGVDTVLRVVAQLHAEGKHPTTNAVSLAAGKSPTWAKPYLGQAAIDGLLVANLEDVPRTKGKKMVYRPADSTEAAA